MAAVTPLETVQALKNQFFEFQYVSIGAVGGVLNTVAIPMLKKKGDGVVDVYHNFKWKNNSNYDEIPNITLVEKQVTLNSTAAGANRIFNAGVNFADVLGSGGDFISALSKLSEPYQDLYIENEEFEKYNFTYTLPFLKNRRAVSNTWGAEENIFNQAVNGWFSTANEVAKLGAQTALGNLGYIGMEPVMKYENTSFEPPVINFTLFNTGSVQEAYDNFVFISLFTFQNLKARTSVFTYLPPKIYTVYTNGYGGYFCPAASIKNFVVEDIGSLRSMKEFNSMGLTNGEILMPEAYYITIEFQELIPAAKNTFQVHLGGTFNGEVRVVNSIDTPDTSGNTINNLPPFPNNNLTFPNNNLTFPNNPNDPNNRPL